MAFILSCVVDAIFIYGVIIYIYFFSGEEEEEEKEKEKSKRGNNNLEFQPYTHNTFTRSQQK